MLLKLAPRNGIAENGISQLMGSNLSYLTNPQISNSQLMFVYLICLLVSIGYLNQFISAP
jgi:hypothetical protein